MRGSGITTKQIKNAPKNAIFVWRDGHIYYPMDLANKCNRSDLKIVSPSWLRMEHVKGLRNLEIVVDHSAKLNVEQLEALNEARLYSKMPKLESSKIRRKIYKYGFISDGRRDEDDFLLLPTLAIGKGKYDKGNIHLRGVGIGVKWGYWSVFYAVYWIETNRKGENNASI